VRRAGLSASAELLVYDAFEIMGIFNEHFIAFTAESADEEF